MQSLYLDNIIQYRFSNKFRLINPNPYRLQVNLDTSSMHKFFDMHPCSGQIIEIPDNDTLYIQTNIKRYVYPYKRKIISENIQMQHFQLFYKQMYFEPLTFNFPALNPEVSPKDIRIISLINEIKDHQFNTLVKQQYQLVLDDKVSFRLFINFFIQQLAKIQSPQNFTFGRPNSASVVQALFSIVAKQIPHVQGGKVFQPINCYEVLNNVNILQLNQFIPETINLVRMSCFWSSIKTLAEDYLIKKSRQYVGKQLFVIKQDQLKNKEYTSYNTEELPFYVEEDIEFHVMKNMISQGIVPTQNNMFILLKNGYKIQDLDTAIALNAIEFEGQNTEFILTPQMQNQINQTVVGRVVFIQRYIKLKIASKNPKKPCSKTTDILFKQEINSNNSCQQYKINQFNTQFRDFDDTPEETNENQADQAINDDISQLTNDIIEDEDELDLIRNQNNASQDSVSTTSISNIINNQSSSDEQQEIFNQNSVVSPINDEISQIVNNQDEDINSSYNNYFNQNLKTSNYSQKTQNSASYQSAYSSYFYDNQSSQQQPSAPATELAASAFFATKRAKSVTFADEKTDQISVSQLLESAGNLKLSGVSGENANSGRLELENLVRKIENFDFSSEENSEQFGEENSVSIRTDITKSEIDEMSEILNRQNGSWEDGEQGVNQAEKVSNYVEASDEISDVLNRVLGGEDEEINTIYQNNNIDQNDEFSEILNKQNSDNDVQNAEISELMNKIQRFESSSFENDELSQLLNKQQEASDEDFENSANLRHGELENGELISKIHSPGSQNGKVEIDENNEISELINRIHSSNSNPSNPDLSGSIIHQENDNLALKVNIISETVDIYAPEVVLSQNNGNGRQLGSENEQNLQINPNFGVEKCDFPASIAGEIEETSSKTDISNKKFVKQIVKIQQKTREFLKNQLLKNGPYQAELISIATTIIQANFRGANIRKTVKFAKSHNLLYLSIQQSLKSIQTVEKFYQKILLVKSIIIRQYYENQGFLVNKILSKIDIEPLLQFINVYSPKTQLFTLQLVSYFESQVTKIQNKSHSFLAKKSRKICAENSDFEVSIFANFWAPSNFPQKVQKALKSALLIQAAGRYFLHKTSLLISSDLAYLGLLPSGVILAKNAFQNAAQTIQRFFRITSDFQLRKIQQSVLLIQKFYRDFNFDINIIKQHIMANQKYKVKKLEQQRKEQLNFIIIIQQQIRNLQRSGGVFLYTCKYYTNNLTFPLWKSFKTIQAICRIQSSYKTLTFLQSNQNLALKTRQIMHRIAFLKSHPSVSLTLHSKLLIQTENPQKHIRSLKILQKLKIPYHENLISALLSCCKFDASRNLAITILGDILPQNFVEFIEFDSTGMDIIKYCLLEKTVESARFLKNLAKCQPLVGVVFVREVIQWRKVEQDEEVRRLLKGVVWWSGEKK
ncbi:hypothetical protein SS50377_28431 [Spironucleus salmonicida]|uniref:Uncharacterized protein n=1 Tax=Spironucleus salmonicida TaxID=348837 RepID=V6LG08_9EUKA|nr:hypothetical protein SS50377_28431 [Spironucleus salmonicida]|eukprot:EST43203.1 Hypothetical protein SS50377_17146 [Spironucleus salmonicida]